MRREADEGRGVRPSELGSGAAVAAPDAGVAEEVRAPEVRGRGAVPRTIDRSSVSPAARSASVCRMASSVATSSCVVANRLAGSFSSIRNTATVNAAGVSGRMSE